jgi:RHS repeat-associated protein
MTPGRQVSEIVAPIWRRQARYVCGAFVRVLGRSDDVQNLTQQVFLALCEAIHRGDEIREAGFSIGTEYDVTYAYDSQGQFSRITGPGLPAYGVEYARLANSDLIQYARYKSDADTTLASTRREYEAHRNLIDYVENSAGSPLTLVSKYDYANDAVGRRTSVVNTGTAFVAPALSLWGYNDRSELASSYRHAGTDPNAPGAEVTDERRLYEYDTIGNRWHASADGLAPVYYCTNALNQYTHTDTGENCLDPIETFTHDDDGNLTADGTYTYAWDGENRLVEVVTTRPPEQYQNGDKKLRFAYDYMGRRVRKQVFTWDDRGDWYPTADLRFVWDAWRVVMVLDGRNSNAVVRKYVWGLDLSRTLDQAGGIGGLLACQEMTGEHQGSYWFLYDGNGNVGQVVRADNQAIAARYEYDPYGNTLVAEGAYADANPFRFSTKWFDAEIGLYYYGYRYYCPRLGRWWNRDPIEEEGGMQLYSFVMNDPTDVVDTLGDKPLAQTSASATTTTSVTARPKPPGTQPKPTGPPPLPKCLQDEPKRECRTDKWCYDNMNNPFHRRQSDGAYYRCYRSFDDGNPIAGQQCCYDPDSHKLAPGEQGESPDAVSPNSEQIPENANGDCVPSIPLGVTGHFFCDILNLCPKPPVATK